MKESNLEALKYVVFSVTAFSCEDFTEKDAADIYTAQKKLAGIVDRLSKPKKVVEQKPAGEEQKADEGSI